MSRKIIAKRIQKTGIFLIGLGLLFLLAQFSLRWGADYYLRERAKIPVRIGRLFINPATSRVSLSLQGAKPEQVLNLDLGAVRFDWWAVFLKHLRLGNVGVDGLRLDVEKSGDGKLIVGGIPLSSETPAAPEQAAPAPVGNSRPWGIGEGQIDIHDVRVHYRDPKVDVNVVIHRFHMDPAESWRPDTWTPFDADFEVNGGRFLLSGTCRPFSETKALNAKLQISDLLGSRGWRRLPIIPDSMEILAEPSWWIVLKCGLRPAQHRFACTALSSPMDV